MAQILDGEQLPVRHHAAVALGSLAAEPAFHYVRHLLLPSLDRVLQAYFALMEEVDSEDLVGGVQNLISLYREELIPYASQLIASFYERFVSYAAEDEESHAALAAFQCVAAIRAIVVACETVKEAAAWQQIHSAILPLAHFLCTDAGEGYLQEVSEIAFKSIIYRILLFCLKKKANLFFFHRLWIVLTWLLIFRSKLRRRCLKRCVCCLSWRCGWAATTRISLW